MLTMSVLFFVYKMRDSSMAGAAIAGGVVLSMVTVLADLGIVEIIFN